MERLLFLSLLVFCSFLLTKAGLFEKPTTAPQLELECSAYTQIDRRGPGLYEPSGLALCSRENVLWTVSDDAQRIYQLGGEALSGRDRSVELYNNRPARLGLEGVTLDPSGQTLFMVNEEESEILQFDLQDERLVARVALADMEGYERVARYFHKSPKNKGLEGIAWNTDTGSLFVIKEGLPRMLIELSADLTKIQSHLFLQARYGFVDDDTKDGKLDCSGICYDSKRKAFWVVSDKGQRVFLFDWQQRTVVASVALSYIEEGQTREIEKPEGVALDQELDRLFVVSDKEARLYAFDISRG